MPGEESLQILLEGGYGAIQTAGLSRRRLPRLRESVLEPADGGILGSCRARGLGGRSRGFLGGGDRFVHPSLQASAGPGSSIRQGGPPQSRDGDQADHGVDGKRQLDSPPPALLAEESSFQVGKRSIGLFGRTYRLKARTPRDRVGLLDHTGAEEKGETPSFSAGGHAYRLGEAGTK